jgi:hypothetical protein
MTSVLMTLQKKAPSPTPAAWTDHCVITTQGSFTSFFATRRFTQKRTGPGWPLGREPPGDGQDIVTFVRGYSSLVGRSWMR